MTWMLQSLLSFSKNVSDISPLNLFTGLLVLAIASVIYTEKLRIPLTGYWSLVPPLFMILNPYLAQCILYSYDSLTILIAFAVALVASLQWRPAGGQQFISDVLLLVIVMVLYQSGLNVFIAGVALMIVSRVGNGQPVWHWLSGKVTALLVAVFIYKFAISMPLIPASDTYSMRHNQLLMPGSGALDVLTGSVQRYYSLFISAYPGWTAGFALIPLILGTVALGVVVCRLHQRRPHNAGLLLLMVISLSVAVGAVAGLSLLLAIPVFAPRMLAAWGVTVLFCFFISVQAWPALRHWLA